MRQLSDTCESMISSAGGDELLAWFLAEAADAPAGPGVKPSMDYLLSALRPLLEETTRNQSGASCLKLLLQGLNTPQNRKVLKQAKAQREQGRSPAYELQLSAADGSSYALRVCPRPVNMPDGTKTFLASLELGKPVAQQPEPESETAHFLHASHEKLRVLFDLVPIGITISDDTGRILEANPASEAILGLPIGEQTRRDIDGLEWQIVRPDGSPMPAQDYASVRALKTGQPSSNEEMGILRPDGETRWISVTAAPLPLPGYGVVVTYVDITRIREASAALRNKERRYRLAVESGKVCVWEWELKSGALQLDPQFHALLGFDPQELRNADEWLELIHPEDRPRFEAILHDHLRGDVPVFECEHRKLHKNGEVLWFLSRGAVLGDDKGLLLSGADLDITQRKQAEQAVEQERKRLFSLLDRLPAFVCLLAPDASIRFANRFFGEIVNSREKLQEYEAMHAGQDGESGPLQDIFALRSLSIWEWECRSSGRVYQMYGYPYEDLDGSPLVLELGIDITSSKRAQEALRASEERYRSIADNLAMGLTILDRDLRLRAANPILRQWAPDVDFDTAPYCWEVLCNGAQEGPCLECPVPIVRADGRVRETLYEVELPHGLRQLQVTCSPMFEPDGAVETVIMLLEDVTEKLEVQAKLQRAHKLEALGTLAGGIAHEINQPLNALQLYVSGLEMLVEKDRQPERDTLLTRLGWIMRESDKIHEIISHMRSLVHQEAGPTRPGAADFNECVRDALSLLKAQLNAHGIVLEIDTAPDLPLARANPVQLEQVVINLVVNAMQALDSMNSEAFTEQGKRIVVSTRYDAEALTLEVRDNGPGLQGLEDRMFDPFFTSKEAGTGMGLGLSIVHTFVESWGGEIRGVSLDTGGAVFTVRLLPAPGARSAASQSRSYRQEL